MNCLFCYDKGQMFHYPCRACTYSNKVTSLCLQYRCWSVTTKSFRSDFGSKFRNVFKCLRSWTLLISTRFIPTGSYKHWENVMELNKAVKNSFGICIWLEEVYWKIVVKYVWKCEMRHKPGPRYVLYTHPPLRLDITLCCTT